MFDRIPEPVAASLCASRLLIDGGPKIRDSGRIRQTFRVSPDPTRVVARAALQPGAGFSLEPGSSGTIGILPIALDDPTWTALMNGAGPDQYTVSADGTVNWGPDGVLEVNLYPNGTADLPPGNRGTVDIGSPKQQHPGPGAADPVRPR